MFITCNRWRGSDSVNPSALQVKPSYGTPSSLANGSGSQVIYSERGPPFYEENDLEEYICHGECVPRSSSPSPPNIAQKEHSKSASVASVATWEPEIQSGGLEITNLQLPRATWTANHSHSSQAYETKTYGYITYTHLKTTTTQPPTSAVTEPSPRSSVNTFKVSSPEGLGSQDGKMSVEQLQRGTSGPPENSQNIHNSNSTGRVESGPSEGRNFRRSGSIYAGKTADEIDVENEEIPYAQLIYKALMSVPTRTMILSEIYQYFREKIPRFSKMRSKGWQNSIRHNLSMNGAFHKVERPPGQDGVKRRGYYWVLTEEAEREGVKSTTRFRKNSATNRRRLSETSTSSRSSNYPSSRRRRTRGAHKAPSNSLDIRSEIDRQSSSTPTAEGEVISDSSPSQSEANGHHCYDIMVSKDSILSSATNSQFEADSKCTILESTFFNPQESSDSFAVDCNNTWPTFSQPNHNLYENRQVVYDNENINAAFNEEFALIQSSQAHQERTFANEILPPASLATNAAAFAFGLWLSSSGGGFW